MVKVEESGDKLTEKEIIQQCHLLLLAGNVTTADLLGNGMRALIEHPSEMKKLREDPELLRNAIEEMLRFDSPVINTARAAYEDMEIGGCSVKKGQAISLLLGAANHDPSVNPNPAQFDITRESIGH